MKKYLIIISLLVLSFALFGANKVFAGSATLSWNANTDSDLAGYKIYYGTSSRTGDSPGIGTNPISGKVRCGMCGYTSSVIVGNVTSYTFSNLTDGYTYYFSVTAYDTASPANESDFSSPEVSKPLPVVSYIINLNFTPSLEGTTAASKTFTITLYQGTTQLAQFSVQPTSGQIPLPVGTNLAPGTYDLTIDAQYYLKVRQNNISLSSNSTVTLLALKAGNLNNDGVINSLDWSSMNSNWFSSTYPADINQDGVVNSVDFSWMNKNWLQSDA